VSQRPTIHRTILFILGLQFLLAVGLGADSLFDDPVVVKSKLFEIRESDVQETYVGQKAAAAALGQRQPPGLESQMKRQIVEKMIATKLLLARANTLDKDAGARLGQRLIAEGKDNAGSEASYRRRLLAVGSSPEHYEAEVIEQATVQAVIDRELKSKVIVTDAEIKKFHEENAAGYQEPEKARVTHILFATRKIPGGEPLAAGERQAKKAAAERALARARTGEAFDKLAAELSEDPEVQKNQGELRFTCGAGTVPPQFESAALSLEPGQISAIVTTVFGYHIIKLLEKTPAGQISLDQARERIREILQRQRVQARLLDFLAQLRQEAAVELVLQP
jgi:peptidyl-prolyl cis-trans isomerase C